MHNECAMYNEYALRTHSIRKFLGYWYFLVLMFPKVIFCLKSIYSQSVINYPIPTINLPHGIRGAVGAAASCRSQLLYRWCHTSKPPPQAIKACFGLTFLRYGTLIHERLKREIHCKTFFEVWRVWRVGIYLYNIFIYILYIYYHYFFYMKV